MQLRVWYCLTGKNCIHLSLTMTSRLLTPLCTLFILIGLSSCKKGEITYDFDGRITETVNGGPLEGVNVEVRQVLFSSSVANYNYQLAGSSTSDANGDWSVSFKRERVTDFRIHMAKEGYFDVIYEFPSGEVTVEEVNSYTTAMDTEAWVKLDIENVGPLAGDEMVMTLINFREGCEGCGTNGYYEFGEIVDTVMLFKTTGGRYARFQFDDKGTASLVEDSVMTVPSDTVTYTFQY